MRFLLGRCCAAFAIAIVLLLGVSSHGAVVARYDLDEGQGPTCGDTSGSGANARCIGNAAWIDGHNSASMGAMSFDGDTYVQAKNSAVINALSSAFSLTAWIKPDLDSTHDTIVWKSGAFRIWKQNSNLMVTLDGIASDLLIIPGTMLNGTWQHVAVTFDGQSVRGYLNGIYKRRLTAVGTIAGNLNPLRLGWYSSTPYLRGALDNVRLYDRALSSTEIAADMTLGTPASPEPFAIVASGSVQTAVVTPDGCDAVITQAAELLRDVVYKASGQMLTIYAESAAPSGYVGLVYVGNCDATTDSGIEMAYFAGCNYVIRQYGSDLFLVGNDEEALTGSGTYFAVAEFLSQTLVARWLWPGDSGLYVPSCSDIIVSDCDQMVIQQLLHTRLRVGGALAGLDGWSSEPVKIAFLAAQGDWMLNNQVGGSSISLYYPHGFEDYYDRFSTTHPEYFNRLPDGTHRPDPYFGTAGNISMSVAQPSLWSQIVDDWIADGADTGGTLTPWINCNENDTWGKCTDPCSLAWDVEPLDFEATYGCTWANRLSAATAAFGDGINGDFWWFDYLGPMGDRYAKFWLAVQNEAISRGYPNATVCGLAYLNSRSAPLNMAGQLNERIIIDLVPRSTVGNETFFPWTPAKVQETKDQIDGWYATGARLILRPNYISFGHNFPYYYADQLGEELCYAYTNGEIIATDYDSLLGQYATQAPNWFMLARAHRAAALGVECLSADLDTDGAVGMVDLAMFTGTWLDDTCSVHSCQADLDDSGAVDLDDFALLADQWQQMPRSVPDRILDEFYEAFGPAESQIRNYFGLFKTVSDAATAGGNYARLYQVAGDLFTPSVLAQARGYLTAAASAAAGDADASVKVAFLEEGLTNVELTLAANSAWETYESGGPQQGWIDALNALDAYRASVDADFIGNMAILHYYELWSGIDDDGVMDAPLCHGDHDSAMRYLLFGTSFWDVMDMNK